MEKQAWKQLYRTPPGATADELRSQGTLSDAMIDPKPILSRAYPLKYTSTELSGVKYSDYRLEELLMDSRNKAKVGAWVRLYGAWLYFKWGCKKEGNLTPTVKFNGVAARVIDLSVTETGSVYTYCEKLVVEVPAGATSGPLVLVNADGGESSD